MSLRILNAGLVIAVVVLGFHYLILLTRSAESTREMNQLKSALQQAAVLKEEIAKNWKQCSTNMEAVQKREAKLSADLKINKVMIAELTKQIADLRKTEGLHAAKDEVLQLKKKMATIESEKAEAVKTAKAEKAKCESSRNSKLCQTECAEQVKKAVKSAENLCETRIQHLTARSNPTRV